MDEFPNDDEIDDLFLEGSIVQEIDPWLQGSSALSKSQQANSQSSEKMDLEYPDSEDELDLMTQKNTMGKDQLSKLTSTQMVDRWCLFIYIVFVFKIYQNYFTKTKQGGEVYSNLV